MATNYPKPAPGVTLTPVATPVASPPTRTTRWPWSDLITLCERYVRPRLPSHREPRVLEVGCGAGANIPYLVTLGDYFGIDGDPDLIADVQSRYPELSSAHFTCGDFTRTLGSDGPFDVIIDRGSLTVNDDTGIHRAMELIRNTLVPGGCFVGITWYSDQHSAARLGQPGPDPHTRRDLGREWPAFAGLDLVHFTDRAFITECCAGFRIVHVEHRTTTTEPLEPTAAADVNAYYNFVAVRD